MNYTEANIKLGNRASRKLGNNTYLQRRGENIAVRLHGTDVLTFRPDNSVVYDSGGWKTPTTKDRLNGYGAAGFYVWQERGVWTLHNRTRNKVWLYEDGMVITKRGAVKGAGTVRASKAAIKLQAQIVAYSRKFSELLLAGKIAAPGNGDCLYCHMVSVESGKPLGDEIKSNDHILSHLRENYYVPSLLMHAVEEGPVSIIVKSVIGDLWQNGKPIDGGWKGIVERQVTQALKKYIRRKLGMAA